MRKKTITKVMIALVMVALLCALAACGGKNTGSSSSGGGKSNTTTTAQLTAPDLKINSGTVTWTAGKEASKISGYEYIIIDENGTEGAVQTTTEKSVIISEGQSIKVRAISKDKGSVGDSEWSKTVKYTAGAVAQVINLLSGVQGYIDTINGASTKLGADVSVSGAFETNGKTSSIALAAQANANATDPSFMIDFKLNDNSYVSLGYKGSCIYVREPINFVNTEEEDANAFKIDVTALNPAVAAVMVQVMKAVAGANISLDLDSIKETVDSTVNGLGINLDPLIKLDELDDGSIQLGITMELLKTGITVLPALQGQLGINIGEEVNKYIGYANKAMDAIGKGKIQLDGEDLSWELITAKINAAPTDGSLIKLVASYSGTGAAKKISGISLVLDLSALGVATIDYKLSLNVKVNTFSASETVSISTTGFTAQDLAINLNGALPIKGLTADVKGVVRLSDGLKKKGNKFATVAVKANNIENAAIGYINDTGAYVDFSGLFELLRVSGTYDVKYKVEYDNVIDTINRAAASINAPVAANASWAEFVESFDLTDFISKIGAASDKVEFVCGYIYNNLVPIVDSKVTPIAKAGQAELITWAFNYEFNFEKIGKIGAAKDYLKFYKGETTFEAIGDAIKATHDANKAALTKATVLTDNTAGIQLLLAGEQNDLLDYVAAFICIPTIVDGNISWDVKGEINSPNALIPWLDHVFPVDNEARKLVEDILGKGLADVINTGLYFEAVNEGGLHGSVSISSDAQKTVKYIELGAGIGMEATATDNMTAIEGAVDFTNKTADDQYAIAVAMEALLKGLREYGKAE